MNSQVFVSDIRTAVNTSNHIKHCDQDFPEFVHKWSGRTRRYNINDISLPPSLYVRGKEIDFSLPVIAVGGTRSPTVETFCLVSDLITSLSSYGIAVISGGVPGVDLAAHMASIDNDLCSYAILANPVENGLSGHEWSNSIVDRNLTLHGGYISEYATLAPLFSDQHKERLLDRGRIISGLCDVFLVFECNVNSATVDSANRAYLQGKKVICVDSSKKSLRNGISQIHRSHISPVYSAESMTVQDISAEIYELALSSLSSI